MSYKDENIEIDCPDIYFSEKYAKLCEIIEGGNSEKYIFNSELGEVRYHFLKRRIEKKINGEYYYDIITPYGYGGPIILCENENNKSDILKGFEKDFKDYCFDNRIVCDFIRFHPIINNAKDFQSIYDVKYMRHTVGTNLKDYDDPFQSEFGKSCRNAVRKALKNGVSYRVIENPENLDSFIKCYYDTMNRNQAKDFYYFSKEYFDKCLEYYKKNIVLVEAIYEEKVICSEMYFVWNQYIHSHLSGTMTDYLYLSPDYVVMYGITIWGKENGYQVIHTGGGLTNSPDDSLYLFKKKFGKNTDFDFYIGKKIWNMPVYSMLCEKTSIVPSSTDFFPAYRSQS